MTSFEENIGEFLSHLSRLGDRDTKDGALELFMLVESPVGLFCSTTFDKKETIRLATSASKACFPPEGRMPLARPAAQPVLRFRYSPLRPGTDF